MAKIKKAGNKCWVANTTRHWNHHTLLVRIQNGSTTLENNPVIPQKIKHRVSIWPSNPTSKYRPKGTENIHPYKKLYINYSSIIHKSGNNLSIHQLMNG